MPETHNYKIGNRLAASFAFCLRKARVDRVDLTAAVIARVARNEHGRVRISGIDVEGAPDELEADTPRPEGYRSIHSQPHAGRAALAPNVRANSRP